MSRQLERDSRLRQAGYELVRFGWQGVFYDIDLVIGEFPRGVRAGERLMTTGTAYGGGTGLRGEG
jgi:hypothetical protein